MPEEKGQCFLPQDFLENDTRKGSSQQEATAAHGNKLLNTPSWSSCLLLPLPTSLVVYRFSTDTWGKTSEGTLSSEQHEMLIRKITTPVMLFLLSPLVHMIKEFQYAQGNSNGQADNLLCNHPSKVLLVDRELHICKHILHSKVSWLKNRFHFFPYKFVFLMSLKHCCYNPLTILENEHLNQAISYIW